MASFGPVAQHYDLLMAKVPYRMWVGYHQLLLAQQGLSPERMLDVCCGTGTIAQMLAREGRSVVGIDLSAAMIDEARRKAEGKGLNVRYEVADASNFELGEQFDAAYSFFDSLNYITEPDRIESAIMHVAHHLERGGSFIFDLNTAFAFEEKMFDQKDLRQKAPIQYRWRGDYDSRTRLIQVHMDFWRGGEHFTECHVQRAHTDEEIREWLKRAGFEFVRCYDSYTLDPPRAASDRVHYTALLA